MAGFVGELVTIRYDPRDLAEIRVYYHENFLCNATCQDIAEMVVSLKDIRTARSEVKKELYGQIIQFRQVLKKLNQKNQSKKVIQDTDEKYADTKPARAAPLKLYDNE